MLFLKRPDFGKQLQNSLKSSFVGDRSVPFNKSNAADWRASHHAVSHGFFYGYLPQKQAAVDVSAATAANQGPCSDPSLGPRFRCFAWGLRRRTAVARWRRASLRHQSHLMVAVGPPKIRSRWSAARKRWIITRKNCYPKNHAVHQKGEFEPLLRRGVFWGL